MFFKQVGRARRHKRPILLCVIQNPDDQRQVDLAVQIFAESSPLIQNYVKNKYQFFVTSQDQLNSQLINAENYFKLHFDDEINCFVLYPKYQQVISIAQRIR